MENAVATFKHDGFATKARFSPNGSRVATASVLKDQTNSTNPSDTRPVGELRVWSVSTGNALFSFRHSDVVNSVEFSPDGRRLLTAGSDGSVRVWDMNSGQNLGAYGRGPAIRTFYSASFSNDGRRILVSSAPLEIWDAADGQLIRSLPFRPDGMAMFDSSNRRITAPGFDGAAWVLDADTGQPLTPALRHQARVNSVCFSPDDNTVLTAGADRIARVWDAATGEPVTPPLRHPSPVLSARFSPDSHRIITACGDTKARIWNLLPYGFSDEDLTLVSQVLSSRRIDKTGTALEPLAAATVQQAWEKLRAKHSKLFQQQ